MEKSEAGEAFEPAAASIPNTEIDSQGSTHQKEAPTDEQEYITGFKLTIVMIAITLVCFLVILDMSIVVTAIPQITSSFHSLQDVGWYGSAYLLANCAFQPLAGKIYAHYNSKWVFLGFLALFEVGSLLCGVSTSSKMLIIARAVAGLGGSGLVNGALNILASSLPLEKRPTNLGIMMSIAQMGLVLGPLVGGALTEYSTWRWCFYINLPVGGASAILLLLIGIPDQSIKFPKETSFLTILRKLDFPGFLLFAPATVQFLLALQWGGTHNPWKSATIIGLFCGAAGNIALFFLWEHYQGENAMIPLSMIRLRIVWCSCLNMFFFGSAMMVWTYYLPIYFQAVKGVSPMLSGVDVLPGILSQMLFAILSGIFVGKLGYYQVAAAASGVFASLGYGLASLFGPLTSVGTWIGYQIIAGAGRGCGMQMPIVAVQNTVPKEQVSVGTSLVVFSQTFGGALFLAFAQVIFSDGLKNGLRELAPNVNAMAVIDAGARTFRDVVPKDSLPHVLDAYSRAISHNMYLAAGASVGAFALSLGMGWSRIKKAKKPTSDA